MMSSVKGSAPIAGQKYQGTNPMKFRGQDKSHKGDLGMNPNGADDDYCEVLQQQVHFMELELKILKEKVTDQEQNSGIGSLFDDDKTSHQHISLLKEKYMFMRKDFDRLYSQTEQKKLGINGEKFLLNSQIDTVQNHYSELEKNQTDYTEQFERERSVCDRELNITSRNVQVLMHDTQNTQANIDKEEAESYKQTISLENSLRFDELEAHRYEFEKDQLTEMRDYKQNELDKIKADRETAHSQYMAMSNLQNMITQAQSYREEIETMHVSLTYQNINIEELDQGTNDLTCKKEELDELKQKGEERMEDLQRQLIVKEETNMKRLLARLRQNKQPEVKQLELHVESQTQLTAEFSNKFVEEKEKQDQLLGELIQLRETLKRRKELSVETQAQLEIQKQQIDELNSLNNEKLRDVNNRVKKVDEDRRLNVFESEKSRGLSRVNAAHKSKYNFIEDQYDYNSQAKNMSLQDFKELVESNVGVNNALNPFTNKLDLLQKEIQQLEAMKSLAM